MSTTPGRAFDVIVIGAGPAGEVVAGRLAGKGRAVAVVEVELVGGECSFYACMPSKALLRPAQALAEVRRVPGAAEAVTGGLDVAAALGRRDEVIHNRDDSHAVPWLEDRGVALLRGYGRLEGERRVRVGDDLYAAREAVVLAVGSSAAVPPIPGLREAMPWTNREATTTEQIPGRMTVLGGGPVGVELAQAFGDLGAAVTLVEAAPRLLPREEPFAAEQVQEGLAAHGVDVRVGAVVQSVRRHGAVVITELGDGTTIEGDEILVAVGRRPRTGDLGLDTVGLEPGGLVEVDSRLRVPGRPWLYAIGDVNGRSLLTHSGKYQAHIVSEVIDGGHARARADAGGLSPRIVFTEPQVAAVGLTLGVAEKQGLRARAYDVPTSISAGASFHGRGAPGTSRIVVDEARGVIVGATFTGVDVAEWVHAATIAVLSAIPVERLWDAIPAFPTRSEIWLRLLEQRESERVDARR